MSVSATSWMLTQLTVERNSHVRNNSDMERYWVQFAYVAMVPFAIIETIFLHALKCVSYFAGPTNHEYQYFSGLARSSLYGLLWTVDCIFMNLCCKRLHANERSYINFISNFSMQAFCSRFHQVDFNQELRLEPLAVPDNVKTFLEAYEVGASALERSAIYEVLYEMLPEASSEQIHALPVDIGNLMGDWENKDQIVKNLRAITEKNSLEWTELNRRFIKMLVFTKDTILLSKNPDDLPNFKNQFSGVFRACVNRMTTEMEGIFFQFAAQPLFKKIEAELLQKSQRDPFSVEGVKFFKLIYNMIPKPTAGALEGLISYVIEKTTGQPNAERLVAFLTEFTDQPYEELSQSRQHFIKMLLHTKTAVTSQDRDETVQAANQAAFIEGLLNLQFNASLDKENNEALFFKYGASLLLERADRERLLSDYVQYRRELSVYVMQRVLEHEDVATSINFYIGALATEIFAIPPPPLSSVDLAHRSLVNENYRAAIATTFRKCYLSTHTIYAFFYEIICPKQPQDKNSKLFSKEAYEKRIKEKYFLKAKTNGTLPDNVKSPLDTNFVLPVEALDVDLMGPNPQDVIEFLTEMGFLKLKTSGG